MSATISGSAAAPGSRQSSAKSNEANEPGGLVFVCQGIGVRFDHTTIVQSLDLEARAGDWIVLLGPNGAGKSSALHAIAGVLQSRRGVEVCGYSTVKGHDLRHVPRRVAGRLVAMVPQSPVVPPGMLVEDYVLLGRTPHLGWWGRPGVRDRAVVADLLARLDLSRLAGRAVFSLSGGEMQRAVIARALAQEAPVLVLDEPTSALDVGHQQQVLELVDELRAQHGLVVLSAMHDLTLAGQYAHHLVLLVDGQPVSTGTPRHVLVAEVLEHRYNARLQSVHIGDEGVAVFPVRPIPLAVE